MQQRKFVSHITKRKLIPVAERYNARVYGRSLAGIAGLNPGGDGCLSFVSVVCVARYRSLRRADPRPQEFYRL